MAKESFDCVFRMVTFRPCVSKLDERIKSKLTAKLMKRAPGLARFTYKYFKIISWAFTISFFASMIYSAYGIYNLIAFGTCTPGSPGQCAVNQVAYFFSCYEAQVVYAIIIIAVAIALYFGLKRYVKLELT
ncbi:MAG TPA: hypothetical protein VJ343_01010 [archaeon]|nr:hypothetical protein [archaeon]